MSALGRASLTGLGGVERAFIAELDAAPRGASAVVADVGANDGTWSRQWSEIKRAATEDGKVLSVYLFEPQPRFVSRLSAMARQHNFTFVHAAAARADGEQSFTLEGAKDSKSASLAGSTVSAAGMRTSVRTIDLAAFLRVRLVSPARASPSLMKLDTEGFEYQLLPWLIAQGALCHLTHLHIEWHLNMLPPEQRLSALGLRLNFGTLLEHGCTTPPMRIHHDEFPANNQALPVPGLARVLLEHSSWSGESRGGRRHSAWTAGMEREDAEYFAGRRDGVAAEAQQRQAEQCAKRHPRCSGTCDYEALRCDTVMAQDAYETMLENRLPVTELGLFARQNATSDARAQRAGAHGDALGKARRPLMAGVMHCGCERYPLRRNASVRPRYAMQPVYPLRRPQAG